MLSLRNVFFSYRNTTFIVSGKLIKNMTRFGEISAINSLMGHNSSMKHNLVIAQPHKSVPVSKTTYMRLPGYTFLKEMHNNYFYF